MSSVQPSETQKEQYYRTLATPQQVRSTAFGANAARPLSGQSKASLAQHAESNKDLHAQGVLTENKSEGQLAKEEEEKKQARNRLAAIECARRVKARKRKEKREKAKEAKRVKSESVLPQEKPQLVF